MERRLIIIDPYDDSNGVFNYLLKDDEYHMTTALSYAYYKRIPNLTDGYNDLASNNYIVIFSIDNNIEIFAGMVITNTQVNLLKEIFDVTFDKYKDLNLILMVFENNNIKLLKDRFKSVDELIEYKNNYLQGDDLDVRKKI